MKNIIILGVARSGKTTLARMIKQKYSNYNIIDGDCIRTTFEKVMPKLHINHINGEGMTEKFPEFCSKLFEYQVKEHKGHFNYIFESCDISPFQLKKYFNIKDTIVLFLGYPNLTIEETFNNYKKYALENDYMAKKTDKEIMDRAIMWTEKSNKLKEECSKYKIRFIDVSYNRNNTFEKLIEELCDNEEVIC